MTIQGHTVLQKLGLGIKVTTQARQKISYFLVMKMPRSRYVISFRNSRGKLGVHNPLTPGKYAVYFTFSSRRKLNVVEQCAFSR